MTDENPVGRPTKMIPLTIKKLEEAFAMGCTDLEACLYAGISKPTLYKYQEENPEFLDRKEALKEQPVLKSRKIVIDALDEGDKQTAQWYLERKKKDEFSQKTVQDSNHSGSLTIKGEFELVKPKADV